MYVPSSDNNEKKRQIKRHYFVESYQKQKHSLHDLAPLTRQINAVLIMRRGLL